MSVSDTLEPPNSVTGDTTRARLSNIVDEVRHQVESKLCYSPPVDSDGGEESPAHSASTSLDDHSPEDVEWKPCRIECRKGCIEPSGVCVGPEPKPRGRRPQRACSAARAATASSGAALDHAHELHHLLMTAMRPIQRRSWAT